MAISEFQNSTHS